VDHQTGEIITGDGMDRFTTYLKETTTTLSQVDITHFALNLIAPLGLRCGVLEALNPGFRSLAKSKSTAAATRGFLVAA